MRRAERKLSLWLLPAVALAVFLLLHWGDENGPFSVRADGQTTGTNGIGTDDDEPTTGQTIRLTPPPGGVLYEWDFDFRSVFRPTYSSRRDGPVLRFYPFPGVFIVRCRVHDPSGTFVDCDLTLTVTSTDPFSVGLVASPPAGPAPLDVTLTATPSIAGEFRYLWDYEDDGRWDEMTREPVVARRYAQPGGFTTRVGVMDDEGIGATGTVAVTVPSPGGLITVTGVTINPLTPRVGDRVTFVATAGGGTPTDYLWDFDDDGRIDAVTTTATASWRYTRPGSNTLRVGARNAAGVETFSIFGLSISVQPGTPRCWISSPKPASTASGDRLSIQVDISPGFAATQADFYFRPHTGSPPPPAGDPSWILIQHVSSTRPRIGTAWDISAFVPGQSFDLLAVAANAAGTVTASSLAIEEVMVTIVSASPDRDETQGRIGAVPQPYTESINIGVPPGEGAEAETAEDFRAEIPSLDLPVYRTWRVERRGTNPHPVEGTMQLRTFDPDSFRTFTIDGIGFPRILGRLTRYVGGEGLDRLLNGRPMSDFVFTAYQFDDETRVWTRIADALYHPEDQVLQAAVYPSGDFAIHVEVRRTPNGESGGDCGLLGAEILLLLPWLLRRRRRA
jgi:PKD repeat protein